MVTGTLETTDQHAENFSLSGERHLFSLTMAQNLGATGSITFLLMAQIESHSSETIACDGP